MPTKLQTESSNEAPMEHPIEHPMEHPIEPIVLTRIRVVMVNTSHPGNIGAAARAMKNMGLSHLVLVAPKAHPSFEAYSRAVGADDVLAEATVVDTLAEALSGCVWVAGTSARLRTVRWPVLLPHDCAQQAMVHAHDGDIAIVFGRERTGLSNEELELCNVLLHIPTNPDYSSLNVAAAIQVVAYELRRAALNDSTMQQQLGNKHDDDVPASVELMQGMYEHLYQTLDDIKFFGTNNPDIVMRRLKGLFNRAQTTVREVAILRGIYSAAQGKKAKRTSRTGSAD
jgi:tRNA (cytidine32/uridine32-2'-O)-methyltransferase